MKRNELMRAEMFKQEKIKLIGGPFDGCHVVCAIGKKCIAIKANGNIDSIRVIKERELHPVDDDGEHRYVMKELDTDSRGRSVFVYLYGALERMPRCEVIERIIAGYRDGKSPKKEAFKEIDEGEEKRMQLFRELAGKIKADR